MVLVVGSWFFDLVFFRTLVHGFGFYLNLVLSAGVWCKGTMLHWFMEICRGDKFVGGARNSTEPG